MFLGMDVMNLTVHENNNPDWPDFKDLVGTSNAIQKLRLSIKKVARTESTVLILGDTGTGKEVVARNIHKNSYRWQKPLVAVNCGAIPAELLESELFGHEKGAFTGALTSRKGRFELADGGTLFLDEIGDMPLMMQVKLLRVLQEQSFERVGSNQSISVNVRIIAATHQNLEQAIIDGKFREDLYYRLNVFPIKIPRLVERLDDLSILAETIINRLSKMRMGNIKLSTEALHALCLYSWPGNIRELSNLLERLAILKPGENVDVADLPGNILESAGIDPNESIADLSNPGPVLLRDEIPTDGLDLKKLLEDLEQRLIKQALQQKAGVVAHAADLLKTRRTTLVEKMRKYDITRQS